MKDDLKGVAKQAMEWFKESVVFEGEPYVIDIEQAMAVVSDKSNTIVVARAGSGKTRTIVAKIVYLIAKCRVKPEEIMAFVFNANAAAEINERLGKMMVNGMPVVENTQIASTFHAFSRKIVYDVCDGRERCKRILAGEKDEFVLAIVRRMLKEEEWQKRIELFVKEEVNEEEINDEEIVKLGGMMALFINRAQQRYLNGEIAFREKVEEYINNTEITEREQVFIEIGMECYKRYHWYLLDEKWRAKLGQLKGLDAREYGTDFNLIVSWASKLIRGQRKGVAELLSNKRYVLVDEYQDFSQLFLAEVMAIRSLNPEVKLFVVGDDWQAINRFAGSDVDYFKNFQEYFPDDWLRLEISTNYRCDYEIVDTARRFMKKAMRERGNFRAFSKKSGKVLLVDPRKTDLGLALVDYDKRVSARDKMYKKIAQEVMGRSPKKSTVQYFKTVAKIISENKEREKILILHRNNETNIEGIELTRFGDGLKQILVNLGIMKEDEFEEKVELMTMHKSKGLEAEVVIILEADEGVIPKMHPDTRLYGVFGETDEVALDDQKRLFYVAMTRAKKRLYIMHEGTGKRKQEGFIKYLGRGVEKWEN